MNVADDVVTYRADVPVPEHLLDRDQVDATFVAAGGAGMTQGVGAEPSQPRQPRHEISRLTCGQQPCRAFAFEEDPMAPWHTAYERHRDDERTILTRHEQFIAG